MKKAFIGITLLSCIFFSCKKSSTNSSDNGGGGNTSDTIGTVYAAGYRYSSTTSKTIAAYWRGSTAVNLSDGTKDAAATGITLAGNDVYVAGYEATGANTAMVKYWKNGTAVNLTDGTKSAKANALAVAGTDVFVAGSELNVAGKSVAKYWKNGTAVSLTDGTKNAYATGLFISGTDVYVTGYEYADATFNNAVAKYWKNGTAVNLTGATSNFTTSAITVSGADVYVTGTNYTSVGFNQAYWKNGAFSTLAANSIAEINAVVINQGSVYVGGNDAGKAVYWKDGVKNALNNNASAIEHVTSIFVFAGKVYCGGYRDMFGAGNFVATVWAFGNSTDIHTVTKAQVNAIYVVN
ncbi:hypothetical protein [Ferruginibacter sp. SUN106]|uniref:hypothetical protein n=1 Tax=Ferruginibacter sp. SUN106 TaxID=2978348 RepID=UPI003D369941